MSWEPLIAVAVLVAALLPMTRLLPAGRPRWLAGLGLVAVGLAGFGVAWQKQAIAQIDPGEDRRPLDIDEAGYVGSSTCQSCHPQAYATWHRSYHRTMTQEPSPEAVVAPFEGERIEHDGRVYTMQREGEHFWVQIEDPSRADASGQPLTLRAQVVLLTGSHHEQDYWIETRSGRGVAHLPLVWRIAETRWIPDRSAYMNPPSHTPIKMTAGVWNDNCARCHSTALKARRHVDEGSASWDTHVGEFGISCEACHGPGEEHVAVNQSPVRRYAEHFSEEGDETMVQPYELDRERMTQVCGQCHMMQGLGSEEVEGERNQHGYVYKPGDQLFETRDPVTQTDLTHPGEAPPASDAPGFQSWWFWADGKPRVGGREYSSLMAGACVDMSCMDCHVLHPEAEGEEELAAWADDQLGEGMRGDAACVQCHEETAAQGQAHTHHAPESPGAACQNCHMPYTTWGLLKATRDHAVSSPEVDVELRTGRPNACNLCHLDRSLGWTSQQLADWYGHEQPPLDENQAELASGVRWALTGDAGQRGLVAWHFGWEEARVASDPVWMEPYVAQLLADPYDAVRWNAGKALEGLPHAQGLDYDFIAPPDELQADRLALLEAWAAEPASTEGFQTGSTLIGEDGRMDHEAFNTLAQQRDDRAVELRE